jgi:hypothetical protein
MVRIVVALQHVEAQAARFVTHRTDRVVFGRGEKLVAPLGLHSQGNE